MCLSMIVDGDSASVVWLSSLVFLLFLFSSRRRHTRCALVTGVQTCALPIWGLLVGLAAYAGHLLGELFQAPFWMLTAREGADLLEGAVLAPLAIVAFVLGRELTIWFGAWVAARGRRVTELNEEAQREYERTLEIGRAHV